MTSSKNELIKRTTELAKVDLLQSAAMFAKEEGFESMMTRFKHVEQLRKLEAYMPESLVAYVRDQAKKMLLYSEVSHQINGTQASQLKAGWGLDTIK